MSALATEKYTEIKIKLIRRKTNLRAWAIDNGQPVGSVYNAVKGNRNGKHAIAIRKRLEKFLQ